MTSDQSRFYIEGCLPVPLAQADGGYEYAHLGTTATPYARLEGDGFRVAFDTPGYAGSN